MPIASLHNVTTHYGAQAVLKGASFEVNPGQKLGLIGANGSGKTTILRVLLGHEPVTGGSVYLDPGARVGYVPQHVEHNTGAAVMSWLLSEYKPIADALHAQEESLARATAAEMDRAMREYQKARDAYDRIDGDARPRRAQTLLDAFGLGAKKDQSVASLSGGEKNILSLAQALLSEPDLLLLDEPANHLDYLGVAWLESFLANFKGTVLIVSHNRYLLDRVAGGILELEDGRVHAYHGGYSDYRGAKLRGLIAQQRDYVVNQRRIAQLEELVKRFEQIARSTSDPAWGKRLRARRSQLRREKRQAVDRPVLSQKAISADFTTEAARSDIALRVRGYGKAFGSRQLFDDADLDIASGERVALVGPNGAGKTTLIKDIVHQGAWDNRTIRVGPSIRLGYAAQEQEILRRERTILEEVRADGAIGHNEAFALLRRFLFGWDDLSKRVDDLSGGERNRLQLARLMAVKPSFLVLDEPTNHLDIPAREAVEEALEGYEGTILVVSHDRYFLDKVVNRVVEVRDGKLVSFDGNFSEFWHARQTIAGVVPGTVKTRERSRTRARVRRAEQRDKMASLERRIQEAEAEKLDLEREAADAFNRGQLRRGRRVGRQIERNAALLDDLYEQWTAESE